MANEVESKLPVVDQLDKNLVNKMTASPQPALASWAPILFPPWNLPAAFYPAALRSLPKWVKFKRRKNLKITSRCAKSFFGSIPSRSQSKQYKFCGIFHCFKCDMDVWLAKAFFLPFLPPSSCWTRCWEFLENFTTNLHLNALNMFEWKQKCKFLWFWKVRKKVALRGHVPILFTLKMPFFADK